PAIRVVAVDGILLILARFRSRKERLARKIGGALQRSNRDVGPHALEIGLAIGRARRSIVAARLRRYRARQHRGGQRDNFTAHLAFGCSSGFDPPTNSFRPSANVMSRPFARFDPSLAW